MLSLFYCGWHLTFTQPKCLTYLINIMSYYTIPLIHNNVTLSHFSLKVNVKVSLPIDFVREFVAFAKPQPKKRVLRKVLKLFKKRSFCWTTKISSLYNSLYSKTLMEINYFFTYNFIYSLWININITPSRKMSNNKNIIKVLTKPLNKEAQRRTVIVR